MTCKKQKRTTLITPSNKKSESYVVVNPVIIPFKLLLFQCQLVSNITASLTQSLPFFQKQRNFLWWKPTEYCSHYHTNTCLPCLSPIFQNPGNLSCLQGVHRLTVWYLLTWGNLDFSCPIEHSKNCRANVAPTRPPKIALQRFRRGSRKTMAMDDWWHQRCHWC